MTASRPAQWMPVGDTGPAPRVRVRSHAQWTKAITGSRAGLSSTAYVSTVYVSSKHYLVENYSRRFFLSDIGETCLGADVFFLTSFLSWSCCHFAVKPDKVTIRKVNATMVAWSYPSTWSSPFSHFPLTFQITQLKKTCKTCEEPCAHSRATKVGVAANVRLDKWQNAELSWGLWFFILDFTSQLSWNLPVWGEAEDTGRLY